MKLGGFKLGLLMNPEVSGLLKDGVKRYII